MMAEVIDTLADSGADVVQQREDGIMEVGADGEPRPRRKLTLISSVGTPDRTRHSSCATVCMLVLGSVLMSAGQVGCGAVQHGNEAFPKELTDLKCDKIEPHSNDLCVVFVKGKPGEQVANVQPQTNLLLSLTVQTVKTVLKNQRHDEDGSYSEKSSSTTIQESPWIDQPLARFFLVEKDKRSEAAKEKSRYYIVPTSFIWKDELRQYYQDWMPLMQEPVARVEIENTATHHKEYMWVPEFESYRLRFEPSRAWDRPKPIRSGVHEPGTLEFGWDYGKVDDSSADGSCAVLKVLQVDDTQQDPRTAEGNDNKNAGWRIAIAGQQLSPGVPKSMFVSGTSCSEQKFVLTVAAPNSDTEYKFKVRVGSVLDPVKQLNTQLTGLTYGRHKRPYKFEPKGERQIIKQVRKPSERPRGSTDRQLGESPKQARWMYEPRLRGFLFRPHTMSLSKLVDSVLKDPSIDAFATTTYEVIELASKASFQVQLRLDRTNLEDSVCGLHLQASGGTLNKGTEERLATLLVYCNVRQVSSAEVLKIKALLGRMLAEVAEQCSTGTGC